MSSRVSYVIGAAVLVLSGLVAPLFPGSFFFLAVAACLCFTIPAVARLTHLFRSAARDVERGASPAFAWLRPVATVTGYASLGALALLPLSQFLPLAKSLGPSSVASLGAVGTYFVVVTGAFAKLEESIFGKKPGPFWLAVLLGLAIVVTLFWGGTQWVGLLRTSIYFGTFVTLLLTVETLRHANELAELIEKRKILALFLGAGGITLMDLVTVVQGYVGALEHDPGLIDLIRVGFVLSGTSAVVVLIAAFLVPRIKFQHGGIVHIMTIGGASLGITSVFHFVFLEIGSRWGG